MADNLLEGEWSVSHRQALVRERVVIDLRLVGLLFILALAMAIIRPPYAFSYDDFIYVEMARAFWQDGALHIAGRGGVAGAPELVLPLTHASEGHVYPQYPALYGILAAPFYGLAGVRGLVFLNAASFFSVLWLTLRVVRNLYGLALDRRFVAGLLAIATFLPAYGFGVWPHMLALAVLLSGVERATCHLSTGKRPETVNLILAGLWFGLAIAIRVDSFLPALAMLFWLAIFGAPGQRSAPVWMIFGMLPFLLLASALNGEKFGTYIPLSYGPKSGTDSVTSYLPHLVGAGLILFLATWLNPKGPRASQIVAKLRTPFYVVPAAMIAGSILMLFEPLRTIAWNVVVLTTSLQFLDAESLGAAGRIDANGLFVTGGLHKKALLQSAPWLVLGSVALGGLLFGQRVAARGLCLLVIAAVVGFYSLNQWHGGYGHNMRYFTPALPFLAILAVDGFTSLCRGLGSRQRRSGLLAGGVLGVLSVLGVWISPLPDSYTFLFPTLAIAAVLTLASLAVAAGRRQVWLKRCLLLVTGAAVSMSCLATVSDIASQHVRTGQFAPLTEAAADALPTGSLLVTTDEHLFLMSPPAGTHLVSATRRDGQVARAAIAAFRAQGECVYVHTGSTLAGLATPGDWTPLDLPGLEGGGARLFQPAHQAVRCRLQSGG
jgi:hypothetical protein